MILLKYEILYPEAFPIVECHLERNESIKAESDAMIAMSPTIDVEGKMDGGLLSGLARKFLSGEFIFSRAGCASRPRNSFIQSFANWRHIGRGT